MFRIILGRLYKFDEPTIKSFRKGGEALPSTCRALLIHAATLAFLGGSDRNEISVDYNMTAQCDKIVPSATCLKETLSNCIILDSHKFLLDNTFKGIVPQDCWHLAFFYQTVLPKILIHKYHGKSHISGNIHLSHRQVWLCGVILTSSFLILQSQ